MRTIAKTLLAGSALAAAAVAQDAPPSIQYGALELHGCVLREARFDPPFRVIHSDGIGEDLHHGGWEIVVMGAAFPVRALDPVLWVDGVALIYHDRRVVDGSEALVYQCIDPKLLRAERSLQVIYGKDERTRTRLVEKLDPEKLVKLPEAERRELAIPLLETVTLTKVQRDGTVEGKGAVSGGRVRLALREESGAMRVVLGPIEPAADGSFKTRVVDVTAAVTHVVALFVPEGVELRDGPIDELPKGVERLDSKPLPPKPAGR